MARVHPLPNPDVRKTDIVRDHVRAGRFREALSIAKTFRILTKADKAAIMRAHEALHSPSIYAQMRRDPDVLFQTGVSVMQRLWG